MNKTHRCENSLKEQVSIRFNSEKGWQLSKADYDFDYQIWYFDFSIPIKFCPFCGKEL